MFMGTRLTSSRCPTAGQAVVPDLPGCAAEGDSMVEAVATVAGAIAAWLETTEELERPSR